MPHLDIADMSIQRRALLPGTAQARSASDQRALGKDARDLAIVILSNGKEAVSFVGTSSFSAVGVAVMMLHSDARYRIDNRRLAFFLVACRLHRSRRHGFLVGRLGIGRCRMHICGPSLLRRGVAVVRAHSGFSSSC